MSSYWGHSASEEQAKERRRSFKRPPRRKIDRRASLPCQTQLETMQLPRLHANTPVPTPAHLKSRDEKEPRPHLRAHRTSSDNANRSKAPQAEGHIGAIPELSRTFERALRFRSHKVLSQNDVEHVCLNCHGDLCSGKGGVWDLHCPHQFHKEARKVRGSEPDHPRRGSAVPGFEGGKHGDARFCVEPEGHRLPHRQPSLRRQR